MENWQAKDLRLKFTWRCNSTSTWFCFWDKLIMAKKHGLKIEKNRVQPTENISLIFGSVNFTKEITRNYLKKLLE